MKKKSNVAEPSDAELMQHPETLDGNLSEIVPRLFVSSARVSADEALLREKGIRLVINTARSLKTQCSDPENLLLDVTDETTEKQCEEFFHRSLEFLLANRDNGDGKSKLPRMCIALDDDGSQSIRAVAVPFARFCGVLRRECSFGCVIHCVKGVSRSVSLCAAYLMFEHNQGQLLTLADALDVIRAARKVANPNPTFGAQLFALWRKEFVKANERQEQE